jgi:hypothetical protein
MAKAPEAPDPSYWHPELLAGPLRSKRLTVLYGPPGPARDGMVRRGLMPLLRHAPPAARGRPRRRQVPIRFDGWGPLPLQALHTRIDAEFSAVWPHGTPETLAAHLRAIGRQQHATVLLVLDGFERHLRERAERPDIERFDIELSECITHEGVPVHMLIVVDELEHRALQRYTRWIADFGNDFLRLPSRGPSGADAHTPWHDTDIQAPPDNADDEPAPPPGDGDWPVDLALDLAPPSPGTADAEMKGPEAKPVAAPFAESEPAAWPEAAQRLEVAHPPPPAPAWSAVERPHPDGGAEAETTLRSGKVVADEHPTVPPAGRIEPVLFADPPPAAPPAPAPVPPRAAPPPAPPPPAPQPAPPKAAPPRAATAEPAFGAWPPVGAPAASRAAPPWLSDTEIDRMRRSQERAPRWPGLLGLALYMAVLLGGAWWIARWIIDSQRVETRQRPIEAPTAAAPTNPSAPTAVPAPAPPPVAPAPPPGLAMVWPPDAGAASPLVDELIRRVATPAGIVLRAPAPNEPAALTLMRADALLAARAASTPLQVVAPLYTEQVQVLVRTDARWDYVREIRGLRLNIGRADGARARTARALYQELFGTPLPAEQANELDVDAALNALQQRDGPIDAIVVVSEVPVESQLQPAVQRQVRELTIDSRRMGKVTALPAFSISRRTHNERARLSTTTYLVATGTPPQGHDAPLRALAAALCRAQPQLQQQDSALLRGFRPNQQPDVGYPYVLPRTREGACPTP